MVIFNDQFIKIDIFIMLLCIVFFLLLLLFFFNLNDLINDFFLNVDLIVCVPAFNVIVLYGVLFHLVNK